MVSSADKTCPLCHLRSFNGVAHLWSCPSLEKKVPLMYENKLRWYEVAIGRVAGWMIDHPRPTVFIFICVVMAVFTLLMAGGVEQNLEAG